jgi:hypothetical protein
MENYTHKSLLQLLNPVFILVLTVGLLAQTNTAKRSNYDFREHKAEIFEYAGNYLVSQLEPGLPQTSFAAWFQKIVGTKRKIKWELPDCILQNIVPENEVGLETPMCVDSSVRITREIFLHVYIEYGTLEQGITENKPVVRNIFISDEAGNGFSSVKTLHDLPKLLRSLKKTLAFFDPNHGKFEISGKKPFGFKDLTTIWFQTLEFGEYLAVKSFGDIEAGKKHFELRNIFFDGKRWTFETEKIGGVSYKFFGKFAKQFVKTYGAGDSDNKALHGHLIKFVKGKKAAEADLYFNFYDTGDAG